MARWESLTGRSGADLHWFLVFAALRFTVVMLRLGTLLHDMGIIPEPFGYDNDISRALDELMERVSEPPAHPNISRFACVSDARALRCSAGGLVAVRQGVIATRATGSAAV